jgi:hypothetical protein
MESGVAVLTAIRPAEVVYRRANAWRVVLYRRTASRHERDNEQDEEDEEEDLGDLCRKACNPDESQDTCDDGDN